MKVLIWHGYLLGGTGSNVYTRALARAWAPARPRGRRLLPGAPSGGLRPAAAPRSSGRRSTGRSRSSCSTATRTWRPAISRTSLRRARPLRRARTRPPCAEHLPADFLLTNHVLLGAPVGAAAGMPFTVKAHGSELEFSMRGNEELCAWARESLGRRRGSSPGPSTSAPSSQRSWAGPSACGWSRPAWMSRSSGRSPGTRRSPRSSRRRDATRAHLGARPGRRQRERLAAFLAGEAPTVVYVGKLSEEKGVHLLLEALAHVDARAVVVGFGPAREELERAARRTRALHRRPRAPPPPPSLAAR